MALSVLKYANFNVLKHLSEKSEAHRLLCQYRVEHKNASWVSYTQLLNSPSVTLPSINHDEGEFIMPCEMEVVEIDDPRLTEYSQFLAAFEDNTELSHFIHAYFVKP